MARYYDDDDDGGHIDMRPLLRIGVWGACAVVAVSGAVVVGRTEVGAERAQLALAALRDAPREIVADPGNLLAARSSSDDPETRRLAEAVRRLTADRDRLNTRVATIEQSLNDLTGSISRGQPAANGGPANSPAPRADDKSQAFPPPADMAAPSSTSDNTRSIAAPAEQPSAASSPNAPAPRGGRMATIQSYVTSTAPIAGGAESRVAAAPADANAAPDAPPNGFAIDLGTATNVNALRAHWGTVRAAHAAMLEGLRPLVSVRQSARPGFTEFHLVAGPIADADAAARLCQALTSARVPCRTSTFDGQRLDLR